MRIILFGTVIRTRKSLEKIIVQVIKEGRDNSELYQWAINVYNTGFLGLVFYRTNKKAVGNEYFRKLVNYLE